MPADGREGRSPRRWRLVVPAPLRHGLVVFLAVLLVEYVAAPEVIGVTKHLDLLVHVKIAWLVAGVASEGAALSCYALLTRTLLPGRSPGISRLVRIVLATTAIGHVVPAGAAGSAGLGYRLLTTEGVAGPDAGFALATAAMGSAVVLNVLLWFSLVVSIPLAGFHPLYVVVALVGLLALLAASALVYTFTRGEERAVRVVRAFGRRMPRVGGDRLEHVVRELAASLERLVADPHLLARAGWWAALNWLLDAASLWCFIAALGRFVDPFELFAAYGIANLLAVVPVTPGGLGVVDASAPALLVSFGVPGSVAAFGVLGWRMVNFWLPIPAGAAAYLSLRVPTGSSVRARRRALSDMTAEAKPPDDSSGLDQSAKGAG